MNISDKTRRFEILAVVITALCKFVFMDILSMRLVYMLAVIIFWMTYLIYRSSTTPGLATHWGFRTDNTKKVALAVLPFGGFCIAAFVGIGIYQHSMQLSWHIIPILILYPLWAVIQQLLLIALTVGNLKDYQQYDFSKAVIIIVPALIFAVIHYPSAWLMIGSFVLALFYATIYLKERNLYVLGIFHAWLGALFLYIVMGVDPFIEIFGSLLSIK